MIRLMRIPTKTTYRPENRIHPKLSELGYHALMRYNEGDQLVNTFQIPQCNVDARDSGHQHRPTTVEAQSPGGLPEMLDITVTTR